MAGHSAVAETMNGAGPVSEVAAELTRLEAAMADPDRLDDMDEIIHHYGEVQHGSRNWTATRWRAAPAKSWRASIFPKT